MRPTTFTAVLLSHTTFAAAVQLADLLRFTSSCVTLPMATPGSVPYAGDAVPTQALNTPILRNLDLRDAPPTAPAPATPEKPAVDDANKAAPNANPAAPNANPVANPDAVPNPVAPNANPAAPAAPGNPALNPAAVPAQPVAPANPAAPANPIAPAPVAAVPPAAAPANPAAPHASPTESVTVQWIETWIGGTSQTWVPRTLTFNFPQFITQAPSPGKGEVGMGTLKGQVGVTKTVVVGSAPTMGAEWIVAAVGVGVGVVGAL